MNDICDCPHCQLDRHEPRDYDKRLKFAQEETLKAKMIAAATNKNEDRVAASDWEYILNWLIKLARPDDYNKTQNTEDADSAEEDTRV